jgi:hypothetical protein
MAPYGVTTGCVIENNNIGVKTGFNAVNHTFVNNTVVNNVIGVEITSFFNGSQSFTGNTICNNSYYNLKLMTTNNANLGMNCWCSTDENEIRNTIFDGYDDVAYGLVSLSPVYTNCQAPLMAETAELSLDDPTIVAYPNPFKDVIHFRSDSNSSFTLQIFDMSGRVVAESTFENEFDYNGAELQSGIYYFSALSDKGIKLSGKLVKE